jgi:hypothetical protein
VAVVVLAAGAPAASAQPASEYELKAAFLYNFTKFAEWPATAFEDGDAPFRLCVVGDDPFGPLLDDLVVGERAGGRRIEVVRHRRAREAAHCQLVYFAADQDPAAVGELAAAAGGTVFTVGESEDFLAAGGLLRFQVRRNRIRLVINEEARSQSRLKISSKLLQLADLVRPGRDRNGR